MKTTRMVKIVEIFCDVCGEQCYNHATHTDSDGREQHACFNLNEKHGEQCATVLNKQIQASITANHKKA